MYCRKCGTQNDDNTSKCVNCGEFLQQLSAPIKPVDIPNYLVQSILVTLFCCLPLGIAAIVFAAQVNGKIQAGDIQGAIDSSKKAKMYCIISFGFGLVATIVYVIAIIASEGANL